MSEAALRAVPAVDEVCDSAEDRVFAGDRRPGDFAFNAEVADVFDDMVRRSVPFYDEMQRMTAELAADFAQPGSALFDLGCATGTTMALLHRTVDPSVRFVGLDNAPEMLARARAKLQMVAAARTVELIEADLHALPALEDGSVAVMSLTLQFVRPLHRENVVRRIFGGLRQGGAMILVEKLTVRDSGLNRLFIDHYYGMKRRNGYSDLEIAQKREALENVMIPYRLEENVALLERAGFTEAEVFFRWYNFCGLLAVKR